VPHSVDLQNKFGDDLRVIFVESQNHSIEEAELSALQHKWLNDYGMWTTERPFETGSNTLPHSTLLGSDGEVLFNGKPPGNIEDLIAEQLKLAKKGPKDLSPTCAKAWVDFEKGGYAVAINALEAVPDGPEKDAARKLAATLTSRAKAKIARLQWLIESAEFEQADKVAPQLVKALAGHATLEPKAKELSDKLVSQELVTEREAAKALGKVEQKIAKDGLDNKSTPVIVKALMGVSEKFPKTAAAKRAEQLAKIAQLKS
jgi:hypothetical protein